MIWPSESNQTNGVQRNVICDRYTSDDTTELDNVLGGQSWRNDFLQIRRGALHDAQLLLFAGIVTWTMNMNRSS